MTDGYVGNEGEIIAEIQKHPNARVFSFGIGSSVIVFYSIKWRKKDAAKSNTSRSMMMDQKRRENFTNASERTFDRRFR
jgi:fructoselysine-6-P-deglycase FrlB-like protein